MERLNKSEIEKLSGAELFHYNLFLAGMPVTKEFFEKKLKEEWDEYLKENEKERVKNSSRKSKSSKASKR